MEHNTQLFALKEPQLQERNCCLVCRWSLQSHQTGYKIMWRVAALCPLWFSFSPTFRGKSVWESFVKHALEAANIRVLIKFSFSFFGGPLIINNDKNVKKHCFFWKYGFSFFLLLHSTDLTKSLLHYFHTRTIFESRCCKEAKKKNVIKVAKQTKTGLGTIQWNELKGGTWQMGHGSLPVNQILAATDGRIKQQLRVLTSWQASLPRTNSGCSELAHCSSLCTLHIWSECQHMCVHTLTHVHTRTTRSSLERHCSDDESWTCQVWLSWGRVAAEKC